MFAIKVYSIVGSMLFITFLAVLYSVIHEKMMGAKLFSGLPWLTLGALGVGCICMILLKCQHDFFKKSPCNWILLTIFTLNFAVFVTSFTTDYNPNAVLISVGLTTAMTTGLSLIGCCLQNEMYWCFGVLATLIFSLVPMVVFIFYFPKLLVSVLFSFCGTILVSVYIILDTISIL